MDQNSVGSLLPLLIVLVGFVMIIAGKHSGKVLRYLFAPVIWIVGNLFRLAIVGIVGIIAFLVLPRVLLDDIEWPALDPRASFHYPVGEKNAAGERFGENWRVTQDFADTIRPVNLDLAGQHTGEDWVPSSVRAGGQPVHAIAGGKIVRNEQNDSYGRVIMIQHDSPGTPFPHVISLYGHIVAERSLGTVVSQGQKIGVIASDQWNGCNKGCVFTAPGCRPRQDLTRKCHGWPEHLHFELRSPAASDSVGFGYATNKEGFMNPTNRGSVEENSGNGWIDQWP